MDRQRRPLRASGRGRAVGGPAGGAPGRLVDAAASGQRGAARARRHRLASHLHAGALRVPSPA